MLDIQEIILKNVIKNETYCRKVIPHLEPKYFDAQYLICFKIIGNFVKQYNKLPNINILEIEFNNSKYANFSNANDVLDVIHRLNKNEDNELNVSEKWLLEKTEEFCKEKAITNAIFESIDIIEGKEKQYSRGAIPDILKNALAVSFDTHVGHDYIANAEERFDYYHKTEDKFNFDLEKLNHITKGGLSRKSLNILMAGTGVGKSLVMCHIAASHLYQGRNVLYITMEMAEEKIAERIDANLFDVEMDGLAVLNKERFNQKIKNIQEHTKGNLTIKEYPTTMANVSHFRGLLNELKMKKDIVPDIIIVDYLNICASSRLKNSGSSNSYDMIKSVAEELRGLAVEYDVPVISATQSNRSSMYDSDPDITGISESSGTAHTCDLLLAIISNEKLEERGQMMFKQLKNRYNDLADNRRFLVGVDKSKMRLFDVDDNEMNDSSASNTRSAESVTKSANKSQNSLII